MNTASIVPEKGYLEYLSKVVPSNILEPFLNHNVFGVLLILIIFGIAIGYIENNEQREITINFFRGLHSIFIVLTKYLIKFIPIALCGFIIVLVKDFKQGISFTGLGSYLIVALLANFVQGFVILPLWLAFKKIRIIETVKGSMPAL